MVCFIFAALIVLLDQLSKIWLSGHLEVYAQQDLIPGVIGLTHVENTGASFGIFADKRWLLISISSVCVILLIALITQLKNSVSRFGLAAVLGGAAGNLIDRIFREGGAVVDMFEFKFINFAIFNVADCFITIGGILFVLGILLGPSDLFSSKRSAKQPDTETTAKEAPRDRPKDAKAAGNSPNIFGSAVKDLSETKILEEYDLERLLREYNSDDKDD